MAPNPNELQNFYFNLKARVAKRLRQDKSAEVLELVQAGYKQALNKELLILSRAENERLFKEVAKELLEELIEKL